MVKMALVCVKKEEGLTDEELLINSDDHEQQTLGFWGNHPGIHNLAIKKAKNLSEDLPHVILLSKDDIAEIADGLDKKYPSDAEIFRTALDVDFSKNIVFYCED